jgi:hypothetical protein
MEWPFWRESGRFRLGNGIFRALLIINQQNPETGDAVLSGVSANAANLLEKAAPYMAAHVAETNGVTAG